MTQRMGQVKLIAAIVAVAVVVVVFAQNSQPVQFKFLFFESIWVSKTVLILMSAVLGSLVTLIVQFLWRRRKQPSAVPVTPPPVPTPSN